MNTYIIYKTTNLVNGKFYVGQHNTSADDSYLGSGKFFKRAIRKYGKKNFVRETIEFCTSANVNEREVYWVDKLDATNPEVGYNLEKGGNGPNRINEITRLKMKENHANVNGKNNPMFGRKRTKEEKENQSIKMKGRYIGKNNPNYANGNKIKGNKNPMFGKTHSKEAITNIILRSNKKYYYDFISPSNKVYKNIYLVQEFCQNFGLNYQGIYYAVKHSGVYKGWKVSRLPINP